MGRLIRHLGWSDLPDLKTARWPVAALYKTTSRTMPKNRRAVNIYDGLAYPIFDVKLGFLAKSRL